MNNKERLSLAAIAMCLLVAGWLDGQDHQMAQKYAASNAGQTLACLSMTCGGGK